MERIIMDNRAFVTPLGSGYNKKTPNNVKLLGV